MLKKYLVLFAMLLVVTTGVSKARAEENAAVSKSDSDSAQVTQTFSADIKPTTVQKEEVKKLQGFLINQGLLKIDTPPTGNFGPKTKQAVKDLQVQLDIKPTGTLGPITRGKLNEILLAPSKSPDATVLTPVAEVLPPTPPTSTITPPTQLPNTVPTNSQPEKIVVLTKGDVGIAIPNPNIPRVMFWQGKVNQHINMKIGAWETDPDGLQSFAGAEVDHLTYCKMFYPESTSVVPYMYETINSWHNRGNVDNYTSTLLSYRCVQSEDKVVSIEPTTKESVTVTTPTPTTTNGMVPRVMFWQGKVNQHTDPITGAWMTDPDGVQAFAGAEVDHLTYCKMFYAKSVAVVPYAYEKIDSWHNRGNVQNYTSTNLSYRCVQDGEDVSVRGEQVLGAFTSASAVTKTSFKSYMVNGSRGDEVKKLQQLLKEKGYLQSDATGFFGKQTEDAIKKFQKDNGIEETGTCGQYTRAKLNAQQTDSNTPLSTTDKGGNGTASVIYPPVVQTITAYTITGNSANLQGNIVSNAPANISFGYGIGSFTNLVASTVTQQYNGSFHLPIQNLTPGTTYQYHACATNNAGNVCGVTKTFTTISASLMPLVTTVAAVNITQTTAKINGTVNNHGSTTTDFFKWGIQPGVLTNTLQAGSTNGGQNTIPFSANMNGLTPGLSYFYTACAQNGTGIVCGAEMSFVALGGGPIGTLVVTNLATPVATSFVPTTSSVELANLELNVPTSVEDVKINSITITDTLGGPAAYADIANLVMKNAAGTVLTTLSSTTINANHVIFIFTNPIVIPHNSATLVKLYADVVGGVNGGTHKFSAVSSSDVVAVGSSSGVTIAPTIYGSGQTMTIRTNGMLIVSNVAGNGGSPAAAQVVPVNTVDGIYLAYKWDALYESQKIRKITLKASGTQLHWNDISNLRLYAQQGSGPLLGTTMPFATANQFATCVSNVCQFSWLAVDNLLPFTVNPGVPVTIFIKADITPAGIAYLGDSFYMSVTNNGTDVTGFGVSSGLAPTYDNNTANAGGAPSQIVSFRVPVIGDYPANGSTVLSSVSAGTVIGRFKVTNNGTALIALKPNIKFTDSGSHTGTTARYTMYSSDENMANYTANNLGVSTTDFSSGTLTMPIVQNISAGAYRYITIAVTNVTSLVSGDTFNLSLANFGDMNFVIQESQWGHDGNQDGDTLDTSSGLWADGRPSLGFIQKQ